MRVFHSSEDYAAYKELLERQAKRRGVLIWLYCQMPNHIHLIAEPSDATALSHAVGEAHRTYAQHINSREGWCGHLWQERFRSFPMDELHLLRAIRYVLLNPVRAGLVRKPEDWPYSSARFHLKGAADSLVSASPLGDVVEDWQELLGLPMSQDTIDLLRKHSSTGRPLGNEHFLKEIARANLNS